MKEPREVIEYICPRCCVESEAIYYFEVGKSQEWDCGCGFRCKIVDMIRKGFAHKETD